jgi:hypothetical protein
MTESELLRIRHLLARCIQEQELDLRGLVVFTEGATGAYLFTPLLAALAGAKHVYAVTSDSPYGTAHQVQEQTLALAKAWGVGDRVEVLFEKRADAVAASDIVTNSGFVRPINREMVFQMKPTAVVPLMFETWEYREADLDLAACRENNILVMGTDESWLYSLGVFYALKLLFELGLEGWATRTLLLGGGAGLGENMHARFRDLGIPVGWFGGPPPESEPYENLPAHFRAHGHLYDAVIVAEHVDPRLLLGPGGLLTFDDIRALNPAVRIGIVGGNVDAEALNASGLHYFPERVRPFGFMSYQGYDLGPRPVLELYAAGLKVGEAMARARLSGMGVHEAELSALQTSPAMSF